MLSYTEFFNITKLFVLSLELIPLALGLSVTFIPLTNVPFDNLSFLLVLKSLKVALTKVSPRREFLYRFYRVSYLGLYSVLNFVRLCVSTECL